MRRLTLTRTKFFVGCAAKLRVYLEVRENAELTINGIPCRQIGLLKNGESAVFEVTEDAVKVFVIADTLTKEFCNDCYQLPEGYEDVALTGKIKFNPTAGNAFLFDDNPTPALPEKKKKKPIGPIIIALTAIVGFAAGYTLTQKISEKQQNAPQVFSYEEMAMTLTMAFQPFDADGFSAAYASKETAVYLRREDKSALNDFSALSLDEYTDLVLEANGKTCEVLHREGLTYFTYESTGGSPAQTYHRFAFSFESEDAFWMVEFATTNRDREEEIFTFAKSVAFGE